MARERLTRTLAALCPPVAVVSSAHALYLRNQQELDRTLSVLLPFWVGAAAAAGLALLLQRLQRFRAARLALSSFYAVGPGFVVWAFLRALPVHAHFARWILDTAAGASLFAAVGLAAALAVARRPGPRRIEPVLAVLAAVLVAREAAVLATGIDRRPPPPPPDLVAAVGAGGSPALPNVYHFLLDGLQDELLEPCWPGGAGGALDGFVRFRARAPVRSTLSVLPAIFSGRWLGEAPPHERLREALVGDSALLRDLKSAGYRTAAFVPRFAYENEATAFDVTVFHDQNAGEPDLAGLHAAVFVRLWVFVTLPRALSESLASGGLLGVGDGFFGMVDVDRLSSQAKPIVSGLSMERLTELEARLAPRGRYTFVHLLLPHNPYVLQADCRHGGPPQTPVPTDLRQQTECALLLVHRFLDVLKRLDRLDASVVVVHGDHGSGEILQGGRLVPEEDAWLRTALLLKPVGRRGGLRVSEARATLVDIAPTLLAMVGASGAAPRDGQVLGDALSLPKHAAEHLGHEPGSRPGSEARNASSIRVP